ncbi:hypothetical protein GIB67_014832 [Kingdonia uniflora]|uniref:non-specific serine/threonine protein kinase n=1 Tax=Kingdonia uniflora TaxID=39325 RepID=A0A7J7MTM0_9MAGN|nr:hypothetical protein GIB67_014832 [Kingdonia uniflora]
MHNDSWKTWYMKETNSTSRRICFDFCRSFVVEEEEKEEALIFFKVNHGNLVRIQGFCIDPEDGNCYLVYEFVENGSLHSWLHGDRKMKKKLDWKTRLKIAIDVANSLQYTHEHTRPRVVHKDIRTSNILLNRNMRAKIANFGLAKSGFNAITTHIVGTQGYIAPEYLADRIVTTKMDVFAFGVVLLELVIGKEAVSDEGKALWMNVSAVLEGKESEKYQRMNHWMEATLLDESCSIESHECNDSRYCVFTEGSI